MSSKSSERGKFIVLEGVDGSGKGTQTKLLVDYLKTEKGLTVIHTREPGGTPNAEKIRRDFLKGAADKWDGLSELLMVMTARRDHLRRVIWPALERGDWVVSERFVLSTYIFQGLLRGVPKADIDTVYKMIAGKFTPDLTLILDLDPRIGVPRTRKVSAAADVADDRFEAMDYSKHDLIRQGYSDMADSLENTLLIDSSGSVEDVWQRVSKMVEGI